MSLASRGPFRHHRDAGHEADRIVKSKSLDDEADGQLIRRFVEGRDERAFAVLVQRRGALVAGVCARMLRNRSDAEDAFQAVFLVLARRATALRRRGSIAGWLHEVAVRVCLNERRAGHRRQRQMQEVAKLAEASPRNNRLDEIKRVIDEELAALPERVREALILCDLEGRTQSEAARMLSIPLGTVSSRLTRGRELMRKRIARHGLQVAVGGVAFALSKCGQVAPAVSAELVSTTVHNAHIFLAGTAAAKTTLGIKTSSLAEGVLHAMILNQWKTAACLVALVATSLFGGAVAPRMIHTAAAGTIFYDDFEDGNAMDDAPVTWVGASGYPHSTLLATDGNLVVSMTQGGTAGVVGVRTTLGNTSIRAQVRLNGMESEVAAIVARGDEQVGYGLEVAADGGVWLGLAGEFMLVNTDLRPTEEDVVLQLDVIDSTLTARAWRASESMPDDAIFIRNDDKLISGYPGVYFGGTPLQASPGTAMFRYVHVSDTPIQDPAQGDTNFDGQVDLEDLNAVRNHFGEGQLGGPKIAGDAYPFDGVVDLEDLNRVRNHFGAGTDGIAAPEPTAAGLAAAGVGFIIIGLFAERRRGRSRRSAR